MITLQPATHKTKRTLIIATVLLVIATAASFLVYHVNKAEAITAADWRAGNIIDDSLFYNGNDMSVNDIQNFLNQKVPVCDTNGVKRSELGGGTRAQYAASRGYSLPIICTKDYYENTTTKANNLGTGVRPEGSISAAQIIKDAAVQHSVGARVLLVLLEKEMSLVTDDWPLPNSYRSAAGFGCPDTAPCDAQYYGFFNQVNNAARQYVIYKNSPNSYRHVAGRNNSVLYNPNHGCGSTSVYISSVATAGLYNYTPYQPNQAALNNLYGSGDGCSAYGNRNFWTMYSNMFGSTSDAPRYGFATISKDLYSDANYTNKLNANPTVEPNSTIYARVTVRNDGNQTWYKDTLRLGTKDPIERASPFYTESWIGYGRVASMNEASVAPGGTATFTFRMKAPDSLATYNENYGVLIEGQRWLDGSVNNSITVHTSAPYYSVQNISFDVYRDAARTQRINDSAVGLYTGSKVFVKAVVKNTGNQPLPKDATKLATTGPLDRLTQYNDNTWINQNRVTLAQEGAVQPGGTATFLFSMTAPSTPRVLSTEQFGIVIEGDRWVMGSVGAIGLQTYTRPPSELAANQTLDLNRNLLSYDERFQLIMQSDGNLVLYGPSGALWSSGTANRGGVRAVMQGDGNLVIYRADWVAIWSSGTPANGPSKIIPQVDGNLVIYTDAMRATWSTGTGGR